MIARLDPAAQRNLQRIFTGAASERVTARSTASTAPHSAEHNSARYTDNNVNAGTNNEAIHHVLGLLAALQRGNGADPAPPPEPARVAATLLHVMLSRFYHLTVGNKPPTISSR
ncbi:hypothetical protein CLOM_g15137 [Closterium sp. NIES-68]|nr:hypothetical protein CLOM_g15137 [Closterium sp. NIES-68]